MTVKILSSTSTFKGVSYNTNKMESGKGELMKFKNFGYLQSAQKVTPDEMKTFLKAYSNIVAFLSSYAGVCFPPH